MSVQRNIATLNNLYAAFGRGDIPAILELTAPDIEWELGASEAQRRIPWFTPGPGREHVALFLQRLGEHLAIEDFEVLAMMGDGDWAVALVRIACVHRGTGTRFVEKLEPHVWRFDANGRINAMRHAADTLMQAEAAGLVSYR